MTTPSIQSVLQQMQTLSSQATQGIGPQNLEKGQQVFKAVGGGGFADELHSSIERINDLQQHSIAQTRAFEAGDPNIALNDVMVDSQKAGLAFEMGVQVRNRLVSAYKEIMNMQI